nr:polysaccharide pyruvyl transferase family protein [uncultured Desulfobacter sp.]
MSVEKIKNILIIQNYNANKGDSSVVMSMLASLKKTSGTYDIAFATTSYDPKTAMEDYGVDAGEFSVSPREIKLQKGMGRIVSTIKEGNWIVYGLFWAFIKRYTGFRLPVPGFKYKTIQLYENADVIVLPGGHFFTNFNGPAMNFSHFYAMLLAFAMRKPTMVYAQTVGPFFGPWKWPVKLMARFVLRHVNVVSLREKSGIKHCNDVKELHHTAETVFAVETDKSLAQFVPDFNRLRRLKRFLIGVTIHHIYYKHFFSKKYYRDTMAKILKRIVDEYDAQIVIIPMEDAVHGGGDRPLAQEIIEQTGCRERISVLVGEWPPHVTAAVIANTDLFIGTKTHSIVYGLKGGVPTISISYQDKSNSFMEMFGLRENAIDLKDLTPDDFMKIFERVNLSLSEYKNKQENAFSTVKALAEKNNQLLVNLLSC